MRSPRALVLALAGAVALLGSSCGDDEGQGIPSAQARDLVRDLQEVNRRSRAGVCDDLRQETFPRMEGRLEALPDDLDEGLREALADGFGHLRQLVDEECKQKEEEQPDPEPIPTPQEPTPTPPTPQPEPRDEPDEDRGRDEDRPPDDGGDGGGDGDGGNGDGGGGGNGVGGPPPATEGPGGTGPARAAGAGA